MVPTQTKSQLAVGRIRTGDVMYVGYTEAIHTPTPSAVTSPTMRVTTDGRGIWSVDRFSSLDAAGSNPA